MSSYCETPVPPATKTFQRGRSISIGEKHMRKSIEAFFRSFVGCIENIHHALYPLISYVTTTCLPSKDIPSRYVKPDPHAPSNGIRAWIDIRTGAQVGPTSRSMYRYTDTQNCSVPVLLPALLWLTACYFNIEYVRRSTLLDMQFAPPPPPPPDLPHPPPQFPMPFPPLS